MTIFTGNNALKGFPVAGVGDGGSLKVAFGTIDVAANPIAADIYEMCRLPAGATIVGGFFRGDDLDVNATETLNMDLGWAANGGTGTYDGADPDGLGDLDVLTGDAFATGNVANVVSYNYPLNGLLNAGEFPTFTRETVIQLVANVTAATFAAGTLSVVIFYTMG